MRSMFAIAVVCLFVAGGADAQTNRIDVITPFAPELAAFGAARDRRADDSGDGPQSPDILNTKEGGPTARYDRTLTLEVWYPARLARRPAARRRAADHHARPRR